MHGQSDVRSTQVQKGTCMSCSSSLQVLHQLVLVSVFHTKLPALTHPLQWSPALRQDWKPQELKPLGQDSLQQCLFMEN